jgi:pimeloyl-ACP methyl ester carboxylesterase
MYRLFFPGMLLLLAGCRAPEHTSESYRIPLPPGPVPTAVVFVANGAGDFRTLSRNLSKAVAETGMPLQVETFVWSRGYRRYVLDQVDHENHLEQGRQLAIQVTAYRAAFPERRVYFIGHSAGCAVVLAAADLLPPDSVNRIILLAPSMSANYDLRPALRAARSGIDVFHSDEDRIVLGLGVGIVGTTGGESSTVAGQVGFQPIVQSPADAALYQKLRQHPWNSAVGWAGNEGGHFGNHETTFLRAYVLPLMNE